jgi:eukaryotic-like serine/threonine-protein kinase
MLCLEERRRRLDATLELFEQADGEVTARALDAARSLPEVAACADWPRLAPRPLPSPQPEKREAAVQAGAAVAKAAALIRAGRYREAGTLALEGAKKANDAGDAWGAAEGYLVAAQAQTRDGNLEQAEPTSHEALIAAEASGHLEVQAEARGLLAYAVGKAFLRWSEADRWLRQAEALLAFQSEREGSLALVPGGPHGGARGPQGLLPAKLSLQRAFVDEAAGRFPEALAGAQRALTLFEEGSFGDSQEAARALLLSGIAAEGLGKREEAIGFKRKAVERFERSLGAFHPEVARALGSLAASHGQAGQPEEAIGLQRQALALLEAALGPEHLHVAPALGNLGMALKRWGDPAEAESAMRRSASIGEKQLGPDDPFSAPALHNLGALLLDTGRPQEALEVLQRVLVLKAKAGPEHPSLSSTYVNLGETYLALSRPQEALEAYQRALAIAEKAAGPDSPRLVYSLSGLASTYLLLGAPGKALPVAERAFSLTEKHKVDPWIRPTARLARARALVAARLEVARGEREARLAMEEATACGKPCERLSAEVTSFLKSLGAAVPVATQGSADSTSKRGKLTSRRLEMRVKSD